MSTSTFWEKMAEKNEVKVAYPVCNLSMLLAAAGKKGCLLVFNFIFPFDKTGRVKD